MKTIFKTLALSAAFLSMFTACQREELEQNQEPETPKTHTVTFVADSPETKTTVDISDGKTAKFAWTADDVSRFTVYENGVPANENETLGVLGKDGKMTIMATFDGDAPESPSYQALYNTAVSSTQTANNLYDETADVLVSAVLTDTDRKAAGYLFSFKRESAIAKMTLKGLTDGVFVRSVTINSDKDIAGTYDLANGIFTSTSKTITITALSEISGGEATVWFASVPVEDATFTVTATAVDNEENVVATYTKTFTKTISLTRGDVKGFGVKMTKVVPSYTIVFNSTVTNPTLIETSTRATAFVVSGSEYLTEQPASDVSFAFYGGKSSGLPLRIGKSEEPGSITLALSESGQVPATKIILSAKQYYSGKTMVIGVNGSNKQQPGDDYTELSYDLDGADISSIKLDTDGYIYVKSITVEYGGTIKTKLATPTNLDVSADKVVSWDAVDGAASYILTIGTVVVDLTCETNSYGASEISAEYYDVAVVAVPSNKENYKNSDAAIFTNVKFGNPTLTTPTLQAGTTDATSVSASWTVDPRATEGYNCELYNGESKVGDSKTVPSGSVSFDGLDSGVKYTIKVNAIAVNGVKSYAASSVATIDVSTKETSSVEETKTVTYTVTSTSAVTASEKAPSGSSATYKSTYTDKYQLTGSNSMTLTLSGYEGMVVKGLTLSMKSNSSSGAGYLSVKAGDTSLGSIGSSNSGVAFNNTSWNGSWSKDYVDVTPTLSNTEYTVQNGENIVIVIGATANSLYCQSFTIEYVEDNNYTRKLNKPNVTCSAWTDNSLTFKWNEDTNAKGYRVSTDGGKSYGDLLNTTEYTWTGLEANTEYTLYVMAIGDGTPYADSDAGFATRTTSSSSTGGESVTYTALFGSSYNSKGISSYSNSWSATNNEFTVKLANWNNSNNQWEYIKAGSKSAASVATITTANAIAEAITTVTITIDAVTTSSINSITLYCGDSADNCTTSLGTFNIAKGDQSVKINTPASNQFYKISVDCKKASNGQIQVSKVVYTKE